MTLHDDDQPTHQPDHDALGVLIWSRDGTPMVWTKEEMIADLCSRCSASELADFIAESRALTATLSKPGIAKIIAGMQDTYGGRLLKMFYEAGGYAERVAPSADPTRELPRERQ